MYYKKDGKVFRSGFKFGGLNTRENFRENYTHNKKMNWYWFGGGLLIFLIVVFLLYFFLYKKK